jgi:hypothetical protein
MSDEFLSPSPFSGSYTLFVVACKSDFTEVAISLQISVELYRVFQKELHNFERLYEFIQRTCTVFRTVKM